MAYSNWINSPAKGFKSIQSLEDFRRRIDDISLNFLIGGNGAGKSNFIHLFSFDLCVSIMELFIARPGTVQALKTGVISNS